MKKMTQVCRSRITFDQIKMFSKVRKKRLEQVLPVRELRALTSHFKVETVSLAMWRDCSSVCFNYTPDPVFLRLFREHEKQLGKYSVSSIEIAVDLYMESKSDAELAQDYIVSIIRKPWHSRRHLRFAYSEFEKPPTGIIRGKTFYFEDRRSATSLKVYCRYAKTADGPDFDQPVTRIEFTLNGAGNVRRKTKIEGIGDLQNFDPAPFVSRYLRFEQLDLERFGRWLSPRSPWPKRAAHLFLRVMAYEDPQAGTDWQLTMQKWRAVAQVRGYLRNRRNELRHRRGRPDTWNRKFARLTDYQINSFFEPVTPSFACYE